MASAQSSTKLKRPSKPVEAAAMAAASDVAIEDAAVAPAGVEEAKSKGRQKPSGLSAVIDGFLNLISSVPFGIVQLVLLIIACKKLTASPTFAMAQKFKEKVELPKLDRGQLAERAIAAARKLRFRARVTEANDRTTIFAERGVWNRLD